MKIILKRILKAVLVLLGGLLGYALIRWTVDLSDYELSLNPFRKEYIAICGALTGMGITFFAGNGLVNKLVTRIKKTQESLNRTSTKDLLMGSAGLVLGLIIANLINVTVMKIPYIGILLALVCNFVFAYFGASVFLIKKKDIIENISEINLMQNNKNNKQGKILDTSAIIDGRIVDICKTGFMEGTIIVPEFVLKELRHIADSHEPEKRTRGRKGLDVLNIIQKELDIKVDIIPETDDGKNEEVDVRLLKLAQKMGAKVITTDYNLNRVADFQGIPVLNINELAKSVKPIALPGEEMIIKVIKDGKEPGQGVGYLDDGTMVVIDDGKKHMGETIGVEVTHVLQTGTGRMIFAKPKYQIENVG